MSMTSFMTLEIPDDASILFEGREVSTINAFAQKLEQTTFARFDAPGYFQDDSKALYRTHYNPIIEKGGTRWHVLVDGHQYDVKTIGRTANKLYLDIELEHGTLLG